MVLSGKKYSTWRLFDDKDLKENDQLLLINKDTGKEFGKAIIIHTKEKKLGNIEESDFDGHEKFQSEEQMYSTYRSYYGDRVTPETIVKIVKFRFEK